MRIFGFVCLWCVLVVLSGYTYMTLWGWFIVPLGVVSIGFAHAMGFSIFVSMFTMRHETKSEDMGVLYFVAYGKLIVALGLGYILQMFM